MKRIAFWSRDHKMTARVLIAICHMLIFCLACYVGNGLKENNFSISPFVFGIFTALFILITLLFSTTYASFTFYKKKVLDGLLLAISFIMVVSFANQKDISSVTSFNRLSGSFSDKNVRLTDPRSRPSIKELKKQWKELKKVAKADGASAAGIILAILIGLALGTLVASASCSLSCDGQDALAILTLLGGLAAIFFICRWIIRATRNKSRAKETSISKPFVSFPNSAQLL